MDHFFTPEQESVAAQLLESIQTAHEAAEIMLGQAGRADDTQFLNLAGTLEQLLSGIEGAAAPFREKLDAVLLPLTCRCARHTLAVVRAAYPLDLPKCRMKLQFELLPILEDAYAQFYYWAHVYTHPEREEQYYRQDLYELFSNPYANAALESGRFRYDVSFLVQAYNHLDYTQQCVESLLNNIPRGLNYELILFDNGSSDGTEAFFESVRPTKLFHAHINHATGGATGRIEEGRYTVFVSNDVIVLPGAIENMLECIRSRDDIAWVVPATPNVSNYQMIPAQYQNKEEMYAFARRNNTRDAFRWEQRVRLCNPIDVRDTLKTGSREGICPNGYLLRNRNMFPDDRLALLFRRRGWRMYLAKDAYCHHFGSVTIRDEVKRLDEETYYNEGRKDFRQWFGIDPWGTGFCFDQIFKNRVVGEHRGHVEIWGINCGLGSNSLKIKEQVKEYCHNTDCALTNISDNSVYLPDIKGISDAARRIETMKGFKQFLYKRTADYIVWEEPFLVDYKCETLITLCMDHLAPEGVLFLKRNNQTERWLQKRQTGTDELGHGWFAIRKDAEA